LSLIGFDCNQSSSLQVHIGGAKQLLDLYQEKRLQPYIDFVRENEASNYAPEEPPLNGGGRREGEADSDTELEDLQSDCEPDEFNEIVHLMRRPVQEGGLSIKDRCCSITL